MVSTNPQLPVYTSAVVAHLKARTADAARPFTNKAVNTSAPTADDSPVAAALKRQSIDAAKAAGTYVTPSVIDGDEDASDDSPVIAALKARKAEVAGRTAKYEENEDFLRMKAFELSNRIKTFKNLGQTEQYQIAQREAAQVIQKYQALLKKAPSTDTSA